MTAKKDVTGNKYGRLTVIKDSGKRKKTHILWECVCECGNIILKDSYSLRTGHTKSCGCYRKEYTAEKNRTHNKSTTPEYLIWQGIKKRCYYERDINFKYYGARGITMSEEWETSFENFYRDMGDRPTNNHTIERLDSKSNYCKENCVWLEKQYQAQNTRKRLTNTSGVTGVQLMHGAWVARWMIAPYERREKRFSIKKYGEELAFFAACECREQMIELLNKLGQNYGENHGK